MSQRQVFLRANISSQVQMTVCLYNLLGWSGKTSVFNFVFSPLEAKYASKATKSGFPAKLGLSDKFDHAELVSRLTKKMQSIFIFT